MWEFLNVVFNVLTMKTSRRLGGSKLNFLHLLSNFEYDVPYVLGLLAAGLIAWVVARSMSHKQPSQHLSGAPIRGR